MKVAWEDRISKFVLLGSALFFGSTIGFTVPSLTAGGGLFSLTALTHGVVLGIVAILGKFALGFYATPLTCVSFCVLSFAMNGRGEFSFLIAAEASSDLILDSESTSAVRRTLHLDVMIFWGKCVYHGKLLLYMKHAVYAQIN